MKPEAVAAASAQAAAFAERLVDAYDSMIAPGEVGPAGSGRASDAPIVGNRPPTALLYGRVQSGKTAGMILTTALALDNGFRIVLVLTADNVALVQQTADRFKALDGPRVFSTNRQGATYDWSGQDREIVEDLGRDGLILVCAKDSFHLPAVFAFLQLIEASNYPVLILDDEADAATPDTTLAARSAGRRNAPAQSSTIHRRIIANDAVGQEGESFRELLPHSLYVQVTATPFIFFLQRLESALRPTITFLLEPGAGYCGGERFFGEFDAANCQPPIVLIGGNELLARRSTPPGLAASIDFFVLAAAAKALTAGEWPDKGYNHLSHPGSDTNLHDAWYSHIERHLQQLRRRIRTNKAGAVAGLASAYAELLKQLPGAPDVNTLADEVERALRQREVLTINQKSEAPIFGPRMNFLIGGNILGRGLTIDNLLVTYYIREAKTSQMDTVWQHARMYGYRDADFAYTRVFLPARLATRFRDIHYSEEALRGVLAAEARGENPPIRIALGTRPTRPNALESDDIRIFSAGMSQLNPTASGSAGNAGEIRDRLQALGVPLDEPRRALRPTRVPIADAQEIVQAIEIADEHLGRWSVDAVLGILDLFRDELGGEIVLYSRGLSATVERTRGRLSGEEIGDIREAAGAAPALAFLYRGDSLAPTEWFPTLVFPPDTPAIGFAPD